MNVLRALLILAILMSSLGASATVRTCEAAFTRPPAYDYMQFRLSMQAYGGEPIGSIVNYAVRTPRQNGKIDEYRYNAGFPLPNSLDHVWPMQHRAELVMTGINKVEFFKRVYGKYDEKFSGDLMTKLAKADASLEMERSTYAEIRSRDEVLGTWRFFEGRASADDIPNDVPKVLPFVRINELRGAPELRVTRILNRFMDRGIGVTEIGKFSVLAEDAPTRERVTHLIEMDWLALAKDDVVYVAHVTTPAHARLYKKYGFEVAEEFSVPGNPKKEAILWVRGHMLKKAIQDYLDIAPHRGWVPHVKPLLPAERRARSN